MAEKKNNSNITTANVKIPKKKAAPSSKKTTSAGRNGTSKNVLFDDANETRAAKNGKSATRQASNNTSGAKGKKTTIQDVKEEPRRGKKELTEAQLRRHQFVPLFLILAAVLISVSYLIVEKSGVFGVVIQTVFYGIFGIGAFAIPIVLVIMSSNWQKYVKSDTIRLNLILFVFAMLLISSFIEILVLAIDGIPAGDWSVSVKDLFLDGKDLIGGGVVGGLLGRLFWNVFGEICSFIVIIAIVIVTLLALFGATPVSVVTFIRYKAKVAKEKRKAAEAETGEMTAPKAKVKKGKYTEEKEDRATKVKTAATAYGDEDESVRLVSPPDERVDSVLLDSDNKNASKKSDAQGYKDVNDVQQIKRPTVTINRGVEEVEEFDAEQNDDKKDKTESYNTLYDNKTVRRIVITGNDISNENGDLDDGLQNDLNVKANSRRVGVVFEGDQLEMLDIPEGATVPITEVDETAKRRISDIDDVTNLDDIIEGVNAKGRKTKVKEGISAAGSADATDTVTEVAEDTDEEILKPDPYANYVFPPTDLLARPSNEDGITEEEINKNIDRLMDTLTSFKIRVSDITCSCGPTITRYEVKPEMGVRVRSIANLVDDIALGLAKSGVRIEAPIPGKSAVGIEVPNDKKQTVYLRSLIEHRSFTEMKSKISSCLGADVSGRPITFDIHKMPHLLIAGATGMGKSVCINSIIVSILYKAKPDEVKLILIDPKKVEFGIYKDIPHLYVPIVSNPKKAAGALASAVAEMERRFAIMEDVGVRDIAKYNEITKDDPDMEFMPQIVIVIDELADLMMTAPDEVETSICRITQKARAAGIHLIIGTQRPSVDVITGLIKANIPSRIAFTVASQVDSRTIIDIAGAEKLIGRGDMLYAPVGAAKPMRVQGSFVSESEVEAITAFIKKHNGKAIYNEQFTKQIDQEAEKCGLGKKGLAGMPQGGSDDSDVSEDGEDPKLREAIEIAVTDQKVSTSLLQRKLSIGYGRAAKIIDRMQELNIVSPPDGNKPRRILITKEQFMEMYLNDDI